MSWQALEAGNKESCQRILVSFALCGYLLFVGCSGGVQTSPPLETPEPEVGLATMTPIRVTGEATEEVLEISEDPSTQEPNIARLEPVWVYEFEGRSHSRPAILQGVVYVGRAGTFEGGGLLALDSKSGSLLWEFETTGHVPSSPAIADGIIFFSTLNGFVYALDAATGEEKWEFDSGARIRSSVAIHDSHLIVGSYRLGGGGGELFALSTTDGSLSWSLPVEGFFFESAPIVSEGLLLIGNTDGNLYAVDPMDGTPLWTYMAGDPELRQHPLSNRREVLSTPAVSNGVAYVSSNDGFVYAISLVDQSLIWKTDIGNSEGRSSVKYSISSPTAVGDEVFVGSNNGKVYALSAGDGSVEWEFQTDSWIWSTPAYEQGVIYIGSDDRYLYALEAASGNLHWKYDTGAGVLDREVLSGIWGDPRVGEGLVFVSSQNGRVHALPAVR